MGIIKMAVLLTQSKPEGLEHPKSPVDPPSYVRTKKAYHQCGEGSGAFPRNRGGGTNRHHHQHNPKGCSVLERQFKAPVYHESNPGKVLMLVCGRNSGGGSDWGSIWYSDGLVLPFLQIPLEFARRSQARNHLLQCNLAFIIVFFTSRL